MGKIRRASLLPALRGPLLLCLSLALGGALFAQAGARVALVIGNGEYASMGGLANALNDAGDIAASLTKQGFRVSLLANASRKQMNQGINDFHDLLAQDPASEGFFWYAGHGVQSKGENYLIPVGADIAREADLEDEAVSVHKLVTLLDDARNRLNVIVLDACRNNPLPSMGRSGARGLSVVSIAPPESLILYSTGAGQVAADGAGRNSPFAQAFLKYMGQSGDIMGTVKSITAETKRLTGGKQVPYLYSSLTLDFCLASGAEEARPDAARPVGDDHELSFGAVTVRPGSLRINVETAGTFEIAGKTIDIPAGGSLPMNDLKPSAYDLTLRYADGQVESVTVDISAGHTEEVSFSYVPEDAENASDSSNFLFPLYGVSLGATSESELATLGRRSDTIDDGTGDYYQCYTVNGLDFWYDDGIADFMLLTNGIDSMPDRWSSSGFDWSLSYDDWTYLLETLGCRVEATEGPKVEKYEDRDTFSATLTAYYGSADAEYEITLEFGYGLGTEPGDPDTLYSIMVNVAGTDES
jgi:hypothetical protein